MPRSRVRAPWIAAALAAGTMFLAAGCGRDEPPDLARGKELFTQRCGACHILGDADTRGVQGPNLDHAFQQAVADGLGRSTIEGVVRQQIALPMGPQMPANLVEGKDADNVAAYVARAVGAARSEGREQDAPSGTARADGQNSLQIPADPSGQLRYRFANAEAEAGEVTIASQNDSSVPHNIALEGGPEGDVVQDGETSTITVDLEPGRHTFYCSVPGHEQAGMKGTLRVK